MSQPPRVIICGCGFVGQAAAAAFTAAGWQVTGTSLSGTDGMLACDLGDIHSVQALAAHATRTGQPDLLVHCAASGRGRADAYQRVYVDGSIHLRDAFPGVPILFTSSTSVYGQTDGSWVDEASPTSPDRETSRLLLAAEQVVREAGGIVARLSGIYGPGRSVILQKFLTGQATIEEDGRRIINQIHRDDVASAIVHLAQQRESLRAQTFIVTDSTPLAQLELYSALAQQFGRPLPPSGPLALDRKRAWTHKRLSNAKLRATGWSPRFPSFLAAATTIASSLGLEWIE